MNSTGSALTEIGDQVRLISSLMDQIASSSTEQAAGISEINAAVTSLDHITQQNAAMAEESSAATQRLSLEADELSRLLRRFRLEGRIDHTASQTAVRRSA